MAKKRKTDETPEQQPAFIRRVVPVKEANAQKQPPKRGRYKCCG